MGRLPPRPFLLHPARPGKICRSGIARRYHKNRNRVSVKKDSKILIGAKSIMNYLEISRPTFYRFINMGMPAKLINGRWYAHIDNVEGFFKCITQVSREKIGGCCDGTEGVLNNNRL